MIIELPDNKPLPNGRGYALSKYLFWANNPVVYAYEVLGIESIVIDDSITQVAEYIRNYYINNYDAKDEKEQTKEDYNSIVRDFNYYSLQLSAILQNLQTRGVNTSDLFDFSSVLNSANEIILGGSAVGLWSLTSSAGVTGIGVLSSSIASAIPYFAVLHIFSSIVTEYQEKRFFEETNSILISQAQSLANRIKALIGEKKEGYYTGYLGGVGSLLGIKIGQKEDGTFFFQNFNPPWSNPTDSTKGKELELKEGNSSMLKYLGFGLFSYLLLRKKKGI